MLSWILKNRSIRPIGLDIGHSSVKMLQLSVNHQGQIEVYAADQVKIDPDIIDHEQKRQTYIVSAIKQMLAGNRFYGTNTVSCLQSGDLKITSLRLTETDGDKAQQALQKEVVHRFGLDPETDSMDYIYAGDVRQGEEIKKELILFATGKQTVKRHIQILEQAGLKPVAIDTVPWALFRSFERNLRRQEDQENSIIFIDLGCRYTTVVIGRRGIINFIKQIEIGGDDFNRQVAAKLGIKVAEAEVLRDALRRGKKLPKQDCLTRQNPVENEQEIDSSTRQVIIDAVDSVAQRLAREISLCLRYYTVTFRGKRVERAVLAGGEAYEKILLDVLQRQLSVNIEYAQPFRGLNMSNKLNLDFDDDGLNLFCEWAVVVGLAFKGWKQENVSREVAECRV